MSQALNGAMTQRDFQRRLLELDKKGIGFAADLTERVLYGSKAQRIFIDFCGLTIAEVVSLIWNKRNFEERFLEEVRQGIKEDGMGT